MQAIATGDCPENTKTRAILPAQAFVNFINCSTDADTTTIAQHQYLYARGVPRGQITTVAAHFWRSAEHAD